MAKITLTKEWQALPYTTGTIENSSIGAIELATTEDNGISLLPKQRYEFRDIQIKARAVTFNRAVVNVVNFTSVVAADDDSSDNELSEDDAHSIFNDLISK